MANAVDMLDVEGKGDFGTTNVAELLSSLEAARATVRLWLETETGVGQVALYQGQVVVAEVGPLRKRTALLRILTLTEGTYSIEVSDVAAGPAIVSNVDAALRILTDRQHEWRTLCESSPPMSSVLRLSVAGRQAKRESTGTDRLVYVLVDGRRSVMDILGESELDPIEALRTIVRAVEAGHFDDIENSASLLPLPIEEISGEVVKIPAAPLVPLFESTRGETRRSSKLAGIRQGTLVGLGLETSSSYPAPEGKGAASLRGSPIIELGGDAPESKARNGIVSDRTNGVVRQSALSFESSEASADAAAPISEPADSLLEHAMPTSDGRHGAAGARIRHVGRYEVIQRIGRGGMGSVYLARLTASGGFRRLFALKLLRSYLASDDAATEAFLAEARLAGQLHHPNVVGVVDAGVHQQQVYLVMDYVEGCSLKQLMTAHPDLRPPRLVVPLVLGALDGLSAVHNLRADDGSALNVVHCDISPENLLVGTDGICRLTDFGVARRARLGRTHSIHGKPGYVAPEQVTGGPIDHRVDIFALGVVLWSALTGERLFLGSTVEETLQQVCHQPIAPPSTVGLRPHAIFDPICLRALERDPVRRYSSAEQMQFELREAAMREGLIGLNSEVASWVRRTVGPQLSQRRLLVLEASRPRELSSSDSASVNDANFSRNDASPQSTLSSSPPSTRSFAELGDDPGSRTMRLDDALGQTGRGKQIALVLAAVLAAVMVLIAIVWPAALTRLFSMETNSGVDSSGARGISVGLPTIPPKASLRIPKSPTVTPVPTPSLAPAAATSPAPGNPNSKEH